MLLIDDFNVIIESTKGRMGKQNLEDEFDI